MSTFKQITKNEIKNVISGVSEVSHGANIQAAARYLRSSQSAISLVKGTKRYKEKETEILKNYISENKQWFLFDKKQYIGDGAEQKVYLLNSDFVIKINDSVFYECWEDYLYSLLLHNYFFPATAYELVGFYDDNNILSAVVKQSFIKATQPTDLEEVKKFMSDNGFNNTKNNDYYNPALGLILEDLHDENVLTENGILQFVDTVFYIKDNTN